MRENRLDEAEGHLRQVLAQYPDFAPALEQLGLVYQKQGKFDDAIAVFERMRRVVPLRHALYTVNIAVLHKMANRTPQALSELESLGAGLETSTEPQVLRAWWYLGELHRESGQRDRAIRDYEKYLAVTASQRDPEVLALRKIVAETLARTRAGEAGS